MVGNLQHRVHAGWAETLQIENVVYFPSGPVHRDWRVALGRGTPLSRSGYLKTAHHNATDTKLTDYRPRFIYPGDYRPRCVYPGANIINERAHYSLHYTTIK